MKEKKSMGGEKEISFNASVQNISADMEKKWQVDCPFLIIINKLLHLKRNFSESTMSFSYERRMYWTAKALLFSFFKNIY